MLRWSNLFINHWFVLGHQFIGAFGGLWKEFPCHLIGISNTICSSVDAPHNINMSSPLHLTHFPVGHWSVLATSCFRNLRPGMDRALSGTYTHNTQILHVHISESLTYHLGLRQNSGMDRPALIQTYGLVWITCVLVWIGGMGRPVGSGYGSGLYILTCSHIRYRVPLTPKKILSSK